MFLGPFVAAVVALVGVLELVDVDCDGMAFLDDQDG
jgi:hypothetical protein